jgi:hypothetical protein
MQDLTSRVVLGPALHFAQTVGVPKLEAEVYRVMSLNALRDGNILYARHFAMKCLVIALSYGMRLRVTASLVIMGQVERAFGNRQTAISILQSTIQLAEKQSYTLQIEKAERKLVKMTPEVK